MNRIQNPEIDSHKYIQLIFNKGAKVFNRQRVVPVQQMVLGQPGLHIQTFNLDETLHLSQKLT